MCDLFQDPHRFYEIELEHTGGTLSPDALCSGVRELVVSTYGKNAVTKARRFLDEHAPDANATIVVDGDVARGPISGSVVAAPKTDGDSFTMHAKFMAARVIDGNETYLRLCVTSANFHAGDWGKTRQIVWVCDFPEQADDAGAAPTPFARTFAAFVKTSLENDAAVAEMWEKRILAANPDVGDDVTLVPVVPARFVDAVAAATFGDDAPSKDPMESIGAKRYRAVVQDRCCRTGLFDAGAPTIAFSSFHGTDPATVAKRLKVDDSSRTLVVWPAASAPPRRGDGAYQGATLAGLEKIGNELPDPQDPGDCPEYCTQLVRFAPIGDTSGGGDHVPCHYKVVARAGKRGLGAVYAGSANLSWPGWSAGAFQLGVLLTNVSLEDVPLPFAILNADGTPRRERDFEVLKPADAWLPRDRNLKRSHGGDDRRDRGRPRRDRCGRRRARESDPDVPRLRLENVPANWKPRDILRLCHNHDKSVWIGKFENRVDGRVDVPFDSGPDHALAAMQRLNADDTSPIAAMRLS